MLQDVVRLPKQQQEQQQLPMAELSSPISAQIFEFCDPELFSEALQNSEVTSCSNCCYEDNSSYPVTDFQADLENKFGSCEDSNYGSANTTGSNPTATATATANTTTTASTSATTAATANTSANNNSGNLSVIFDPQEEIDNDISASIDFSPSSTFSVPPYLTAQHDQFDFSSLQPQQIQLPDSVVGLPQYSADPVAPLMGGPFASVFEDDCLSSVPAYMSLNPSSPSCSFLGSAMGAYMPAATMNSAVLSADGSGVFTGSILMAAELQHQELDYHGDNGGIYCPDSIQRVFNPVDLQVLNSEGQHLVTGAGNSTSLASEITSLEDSAFKVGKLSVEQRKEKIHRYMKKRNERNFGKKIKYACRKTLADSRPRVRGRFAKNDDFGETPRAASSNHEDEDDEEVVVKEEDEMVDSSDIFAHISGVNSFKCNYPIQSWI